MNQGKAITVGVIREHFRKYRRKAKINENVTLHTLRHNFATNLIENGATLIQVKELMGHSNIRSTMEYVHVANIDIDLESPLDTFLRGVKKIMTKIQKILEIGLDEYIEKNKIIGYKQK